MTIRELAGRLARQPVAPAAAIGARARQRWARRAAVAAALFVAIVGPWPLDRAGYQGQPYEIASLRSLDRAAAPASAGTATARGLQAGYAEADVTARPGDPLAGYGERGLKTCTGVHDPQAIRALALSDGGPPAVLLTGDLLLFGDGLADEVARRLAASDHLARRQIYFAASHTHSGPGGYGTTFLERFWLGPPRRALFERLAAAATLAAHAALTARSPALWAYRSAAEPAAIRNRVARGEPVDPELSVLALKQPLLHRTILLVVFGAHPTILGPRNLLASGDYPGEVVRYLQRNGNVRALFCAGAVGSAATAGPELRRRRGFDAVRDYGVMLGQEVERLAESASFSRQAPVRSLYAPVRVGPLQVRLGAHLRLSPLLAGLVVGPREGCVQALAVGPVLFLGAPGDINGELATEIKQHVRARGYQPIVTSFAGRYVGYLLPDRYYDAYRDGETRLMSMFGPHNGSYLASLLAAATDRISLPR